MELCFNMKPKININCFMIFLSVSNLNDPPNRFDCVCDIDIDIEINIGFFFFSGQENIIFIKKYVFFLGGGGGYPFPFFILRIL